MSRVVYTAEAHVRGGRQDGHGRTSDGSLEVDLRAPRDVSLPQVEDAALAAEMVAGAHQVCPYSNATPGNVEVALKANGLPLDG